MKWLIDPDSDQPPALEGKIFRPGDRRFKPVYVYDDENRIKLALNVALTTGRPLLVLGEPGSGKSSLAPHVAAKYGWRFYTETVSSRTQARDFLWSFDAIRRLNDAQAGAIKPTSAYVEPGVLWWTFDRDSARLRGMKAEKLSELSINEASDRCAENQSLQTVVLIDEIDKADPDVPNDLLEPLAAYRFHVEEGDVNVPVIAKHVPLLIITSNEERDMPRAFIRRCISLRLKAHNTESKLLEIARVHFPNGNQKLYGWVAEHFLALRERVLKEKSRPPSTAEFLDAISAYQGLSITDKSVFCQHWDQIAELTLQKPQSLVR